MLGIPLVKTDAGLVPLRDLLAQEREARDATWNALGKDLGVPGIGRFAKIESARMERDTAERIAKGLGIARDQLVMQGAFDRNSDEYNEQLVAAGEWILAHNATNPDHVQLFSSSVLQLVTPTQFYSRWGQSPADRGQLLDDLKALDARFTDLQLQRMPPRKGSKQQQLVELPGWSEQHAIDEAILSYTELNPPVNGRLPRGTRQYVTERVNEERIQIGLAPRPEVQYHHYIDRTWHNRKTGFRGTSGSVRRKVGELESIITDTLETLATSDAAETHAETIEPIVDQELAQAKRARYFAFASYGHQALVAFLMDPANYQRLLGSRARLVAVDLMQDNTEPALFDEMQRSASSLEARIEDSEATRFVDRWLRADLVFATENLETSSAGYIVVEVKQHAVNREGGFPNAEKALQQLDAYGAVIRGNLKRRGRKPEVESALIAYEIAPEALTYLAREAGMRGIIVDKTEVEAYLAQRRTAEDAMPTAAEVIAPAAVARSTSYQTPPPQTRASAPQTQSASQEPVPLNVAAVPKATPATASPRKTYIGGSDMLTRMINFGMLRDLVELRIMPAGEKSTPALQRAVTQMRNLVGTKPFDYVPVGSDAICIRVPEKSGSLWYEVDLTRPECKAVIEQWQKRSLLAPAEFLLPGAQRYAA